MFGQIAVEMADRLLVAAEGEVVVGAAGDVRLDGVGGGPVLDQAGVLDEARVLLGLVHVHGLAVLRLRADLIDHPLRLRRRHRLQDDQHGVVGQEGDVGVREQLVDVGHHAPEAAFFPRDLPQLLDPAEREDDAGIAAVDLDHVQIVEAVGVERLIVQGLDVIALHRGLADQLPVGVVAELKRIEHHLAGFQQLRQAVQGAVRQGLVLGDEDQPALLNDRMDRDQPVVGLVDAGKAVLPGDVLQRAVQPVGPGVIGTGEGPLAALAAGHRHAAVAAGVAEAADDAVLAANQQQRRPGGGPGDVGPRLRQRRRGAERHRHPAQHLQLRGESLGGGVVRRRLPPDVRPGVRRLAVDMAENAVDQFGFVQQPAHPSLPTRKSDAEISTGRRKATSGWGRGFKRPLRQKRYVYLCGAPGTEPLASSPYR